MEISLWRKCSSWWGRDSLMAKKRHLPPPRFLSLLTRTSRPHYVLQKTKVQEGKRVKTSHFVDWNFSKCEWKRMELILQSMTILTFFFINLEGMWLFDSLKGVFFWSNEGHNRRYCFIVNNVNILLGFVVVLVWAAVKDPTLLYCRRRKPTKL